MIGPWSHAGFLDNRAGQAEATLGIMGKRSSFHHTQHIIDFFDRACNRVSACGDSFVVLFFPPKLMSVRGLLCCPFFPQAFD